MKKKFLAILMATLMSATIFAGIATVTAEEKNEELLYYDDFDVPTDILPEGVSEISDSKGSFSYLDLICYGAELVQVTGRIKIAYFGIWNDGNIWADAPWRTDILLDDERAAYKTHIVSLKYDTGRSCSKTFIYNPNPEDPIPFQCWTDSTRKFTEKDAYGNPAETNNYNPIPPEYYDIT